MRLHWILRHLIANAYGGCGSRPGASIHVRARMLVPSEAAAALAGGGPESAAPGRPEAATPGASPDGEADGCDLEAGVGSALAIEVVNEGVAHEQAALDRALHSHRQAADSHTRRRGRPAHRYRCLASVRILTGQHPFLFFSDGAGTGSACGTWRRCCACSAARRCC